MTLVPWIVGPAALLAPAAYMLYGSYLHPAWQRDRRVRGACTKAFDDGAYRLVRFRLQPEGPSGADLLSALPGRPGPTRYFTYRVEAEQDPDVSGLRREEARLVRHYRGRSVTSPHYGKEVLHPQ